MFRRTRAAKSRLTASSVSQVLLVEYAFPYAGTSSTSNTPQYNADYDDRQFTFAGDQSATFPARCKVPDLPIVALRKIRVELYVLPQDRRRPPTRALTERRLDRWNDYGIGLFLQGDLKGAARRLSSDRGRPDNPDGWVNLGRVAVQEGDMERARVVLERAFLCIRISRGRTFYARVLRNDGDYDGARRH